jgi:ferredoxin
MRIELDNAKCRGHGRCYNLAADTFDEDQRGYSMIRPGAEQVGTTQISTVKNAVATCPEQALHLLDDHPPMDAYT